MGSKTSGCNNYAATDWVQYAVYLKLFPVIEILYSTLVIIIIIIIIIILTFNFRQGIYNYIPETMHVSKVHTVAAVLYLQILLHAMLFDP